VRRTRWSEALAADIVRDAERSGHNLREFCRGRGLSYERVRRWRIRLEGKAALSKRVRGFLPVQIIADAGAAAPTPGATADGALEFEIGGCVVRTRGDVSEAKLVRALRAAKEAARC
jgi:transposase-like protein